MAQRRKLQDKTTTLTSDPTRVAFFGPKTGQGVEQPSTEISSGAIYIPPKQVRKYFNPQAEQELIQSITEHGVLEPILVRPLSAVQKVKAQENHQYELVFGERRLRASLALKKTTVPALIRTLSDTEALQIQLDENLKRQGLSLLEKLEGVLDLLALERGKPRKVVESEIQQARNMMRRKGVVTDDIVGQLEAYKATLERHNVGTPDSFIRQLQRFRRMPSNIYQAASDGRLDPSKGFEISAVKDDKQREKLLQWVIQENPTVQEMRQRLKLLKGEKRHVTPFENRTRSLLSRVRNINNWQTLSPAVVQELEAALTTLEATLQKLEDAKS